MIEAKKIHERKMQDDSEYAREYEALEEEFSFLRKMILARKRAGMGRADVAHAMDVNTSFMIGSEIRRV